MARISSGVAFGLEPGVKRFGDDVGDGQQFGGFLLLQIGVVADLAFDSQNLRNLPGDGEIVAGDHLDLDAQLLRAGNRLGGVVSGRIEERQDADEVKRRLLRLFERHAQSAVAFLGKGFDLLLGGIGGRAAVAQGQNHLRSALGDDQPLLTIFDGGFGPLANGIERHKLLPPITGDTALAAARMQRIENRHFQGVVVFLPAGERGIE